MVIAIGLNALPRAASGRLLSGRRGRGRRNGLGRSGRRHWKIEALQFGVNHLGELREWLSPIEKATVYEESRRAGNRERARLRHVVVHTLFLSGIKKVLFELRHVQTEISCVLL